MSSLLEKLLKNTSSKHTSVLTKSKVYSNKPHISTSVPMINVALGGELDGGLPPGILTIAGPSRHFKTGYALIMIEAFQRKYPNGYCLFYDSEFGTPPAYFENFGIDMDRIIHTPITDVEELKFDITKQINSIEKGDEFMIVVDSIGNLASKKEVDDAAEQKSVADMSRAKQIKSLFRIVTPHLNLKNIPLVVVNHTYMEQGMYPKAIVGGGCVSPDTLIAMADGTFKEISKIVAGEFVKTLEGPKEVEHIWDPDTLQEGTPECYEVEFEDGTKIYCSESHRFMLENKKWIEVQDIDQNTELL